MTIHPDEIRVAVLMGGRSAERAVSLNTGAQVSAALASSGFDVVEIDSGEDDFVQQLAAIEANVVFICLHGRFGEDGTVQGLCELLELPYVGSGVLASALAMDKVMSKHLFTFHGLPTPPYVVLKRGEAYDCDSIVAELGDKTVVKPASEGSSVGMSIVHEPSELCDAIEQAFHHDRHVLVERFVSGKEVTIGVVGNDDPQPLPTLEIVPKHEFYDYESKYVAGMSEHIIPARVAPEVREECQRIAVRAHQVLGCRGMSRADTIVCEDGSVTLLEVNTIPGMTKTSLLPDAAARAGITFPELCRLLVEYALQPRR